MTADLHRTSRVPMVRAELHRLITEWCPDIKVLYGWDGKVGGDRVVVHGLVTPATQTRDSFGEPAFVSREETFTFGVEVSSDQAGREIRVCYEQAHATLAAIEDGLRQLMTLGMAAEGVLSGMVDQVEEDEWPDNEGWHCSLVAHVAVRAYI